MTESAIEEAHRGSVRPAFHFLETPNNKAEACAKVCSQVRWLCLDLMDFFEAQDNARRTSKWLVVVYLLVTALIVASVTFAMTPAHVYIFKLFEFVFFNNGPLYMPRYGAICAPRSGRE